MQIEKIHHVAYRCKDAKATADFYKRVLNMDLIGAAAENVVPSTREPDPYMNIFLDAGGGNILAFFEVPNSPPMQLDPNTPAWLQHIAFQVRDLRALTEAKERVEAEGLEVIGPIDHTVFHSIYFFDPNGHRLEIAACSPDSQQMARLGETGAEMMEEWSRTKHPPRKAAWIHEREFDAEPRDTSR